MTEDGLHLAAWYVPSDNGAAIVMLHGVGSNRGELLHLAQGLAGRGYGLLLVELRAHGESEGEFSTVGVNEVRDVAAAVSYLRQRPDVNPERVGIFGASLGAATAIMAAAEIPQIRAVVADSSYSSVEWLARNQFSGIVNLPDWTAGLVLYFAEQQTGLSPSRAAPVLQVGRISPRPLLIIHGDQDRTFNVENARLLAAAAGEPKEVWILPGVRHAGAYDADPQIYLERVDRFFAGALSLEP